MEPESGEAPSGGGAPTPWSWKLDGVISAAVFVLAFAAFANSIPNGFVYDDLAIIKDNTRLDSPWNLKAFFGTTYWGEGGRDQSLYRPLTIMSFAVDRALFGPGPKGVHAMNVLANGVVAVLLYGLFRLLFETRRVPLFAALLFAIHPIHTEVVANGVGRAELYAAAFMFGAAIFHFAFLSPARRGVSRKLSRSERRRGEPALATAAATTGRRDWILACVLYMVAMFFKESAAILPGLLFLVDWILVERGRLGALKPRLWKYLVYIVPLVVYLSIRMAVVGGNKPPLQEVSVGATAADRILYASEVLLLYLGQLLAPIKLCAEYSDCTDPVQRTITDPLVAASLLCWVAMGAVVWWCVRRRSMVIPAAAAWFWLAILPVSNLVIPIATVRADRLLFVPSVGFALAAAWGLDLLARKNRMAAYVVLAIVLGWYGWRTVTRNLDWRDRDSLWNATVEQIPGSAIAWSYKGDILLDQGRKAEAEAAYRQAFELRDRVGFGAEAHNKYAQLLEDRGDVAGAVAHYRLVIEKDPKQFTALVNLGGVLLKDAKTRDEAVTLLNRAIDVKPGDFRAHANVAQAHGLAGRFGSAGIAIDRAIALRPNDPELWEIKAGLLAAGGKQSEADAARAQAGRLRAP